MHYRLQCVQYAGHHHKSTLTYTVDDLRYRFTVDEGFFIHNFRVVMAGFNDFQAVNRCAPG